MTLGRAARTAAISSPARAAEISAARHPRRARGPGRDHRMQRRAQQLRHRDELPRRPRLAAHHRRDPPRAHRRDARGTRRRDAPFATPDLTRTGGAHRTGPRLRERMSAKQPETSKRSSARKYRHGFVTDIGATPSPPGLDEDVIRLISRKKGEPQFMLDWRLKAYRHWLTCGSRTGRTCTIRRSTTRRSPTTRRRSSNEDGPKSLDEVDPKLLETYDKLGIPLHERARLAGVAVDAVFDSVSVATTFKERLAEAGVIFCSFSEAVQKHPGTGREVSRHGRAVQRQLLRDAEFRGVHRRLVRVRAEGRALPDGAVDLLPHQRREDRPVRAHADHRRGRRARELPRRLHRADARREPAARRGRRAGRAGRRRDQVLDGAELVSGRRERRRRHLQLRHQARRLPRPQLEDLLDAGRDRLGDHLEIPELHPARRQLGRRVLLGRAREQLPAGRHRHQDDPHRPQHAQHDRLQGHLRRATARTPIAAW